MSSQTPEPRRGFAFPRWSIGFGLEHLGYLTLRLPLVIAAVAVAFTALCFAQFPRMAVDADLMRVFSNSGPHFERYERLAENFGTFEDDAYVLVTSDNLTDPATLERIRDLSFELELNEYLVGTMTPFTLRQPNADGTGTEPAVPEDLQSSEQAAQVLEELRVSNPLMRNLLLEDLSGMVMIVFPDPEQIDSRDGMRGMTASLREVVAQFDGDGLNVELTGPPIWSAELLESTLSDQSMFSIVGFVIGAIISFVALRSFWGAVLASITPVIAVVWVIGAIVLVFGSFSFLTNIVVTLVLVIAFAESMYFTFTWLRLWNEGLEAQEAITEAVRRVLPAAALTSLTTMVSFATLIATQGRGISEFGWSGVLGIAVAFLTFATIMPLTMKAAVRLGYRPPRKMSMAVTAPVPPARALAYRFSRPISIAALVIAALLLIPHFSMEPRFSFDDFLPSDSAALATARGIDEGVGGVSPIYVQVPLDSADPTFSDADFERLSMVQEIVERSVGDGKVLSAVSLSDYAGDGTSYDEVLDAIGPNLRQRFLSDDGSQALVTAFLPTLMASAELEALAARIDSDLEASGLTGTEVAGYRLMTSFASTAIINSIRSSLMTAIILNIFLIGLAFQSWRLGLVAVIPNLLPILFTELYLYVSGAGLQLTSVIALTVAFGIAVDDTVHFLATYVRQRQRGTELKESVGLTLDRVGPALVATTMILCAGTAIVMFSAIPPVALFGTLTVITLFVALVADLIVLPSLLIAGGRFFRSIGGPDK